MTAEEFRHHDFLPAAWAKELSENQVLRTVLFDVMETMHPARYAIQADGNEDVSPTRAAIELGLTRGYSKYGDLLRLLAQRKTRRADVGLPDYKAPVSNTPEPQK